MNPEDEDHKPKSKAAGKANSAVSGGIVYITPEMRESMSGSLAGAHLAPTAHPLAPGEHGARRLPVDNTVAMADSSVIPEDLRVAESQLPELLDGRAYLVDDEGNYLTDHNGAFLTVDNDEELTRSSTASPFAGSEAPDTTFMVFAQSLEIGSKQLSNAQFKSQLLSRLDDVERLLREVTHNTYPRDHNNPPELLENGAISRALRQEVSETISALRFEAQKNAPDPMVLKALASTLSHTGKLIFEAAKFLAGAIGAGAAWDATKQAVFNPLEFHTSLLDVVKLADQWAHFLIPK